MCIAYYSTKCAKPIFESNVIQPLFSCAKLACMCNFMCHAHILFL